MKNKIEKILVAGLLFAHHPNLDIGGAQKNMHKTLEIPKTTLFSSPDLSTSENLHINLTSHESRKKESVTISDPESLDKIETISGNVVHEKIAKTLPTFVKKNNTHEIDNSQYTSKDILPKKSLIIDNFQSNISSSTAWEKTTTSVSSTWEIQSSAKTNEITKIDNKKYFLTVIDSIITPSTKINFDVDYVKHQVNQLLQYSFIIEKNTLIYTITSEEKKNQVYILMDNVRQHIKNKNKFIGLFIWKKALRNFIGEELDTIYTLLVEENNLQYTSWKKQFEKDFHSLIDIYK